MQSFEDGSSLGCRLKPRALGILFSVILELGFRKPVAAKSPCIRTSSPRRSRSVFILSSHHNS
jgi:hypothetical protein